MDNQGPFVTESSWPAPAKLNLFLHVLGRRPNGYHELQTVFQFLSFGDDLNFKIRSDGQIRRVMGPEDILEDEDIAVKAAKALATGRTTLGADIEITKRIPIGGGLEGGSSDAATTLVALNKLWKLDLTEDQLAKIGLQLGADVPVFIRGFASWGEGVGENLVPVDIPEPWYVVLTPPVHVSTRIVFSSPELRRDCKAVTLVNYLENGCVNVCEPVTCSLYPVVGNALKWLSKYGVARMTGTGASVFAAFEDHEAAKDVLRVVPKEYRGFVSRGLNRSPLYKVGALVQP